jgi:2C-methyl-D-erythritol 2,4-cyclodiphosphate synthase
MWQVDYFAKCDICQNSEYMDGRTLTDAAKTARKQGWSVSATKIICPICRKEIDDRSDAMVQNIKNSLRLP